MFLNSKNLFLTLIKFLFAASVRIISPLTTIYASLKSHRFDLSIEVLNLICFLGLYLSLALPYWSWTSIHFSVTNLGTLSSVVPNKFVIFWYSVLIWHQNNLKSSIICCLFFWWYVDFLSYIFFFFTLCFT